MNETAASDDLASAAQLYRLNLLALLPAKPQLTKAEASSLLSAAVADGTWRKVPRAAS